MTTAAWRNVLITVVLAALAAVAGAWLCSSVLLRRGAPEMSLHQVVHRKLDLTTEQNRRMQAIETRYSARRAALEADIRRANAELAQAIQADHGDSARVQAAVDRSHAAMGALQKETIAHVFQMRAVLTPGQAAVFDAEIVQALTQTDR